MDQLAERLETAVDALTTVDRSMPALSPPAGAFGADDAGVPGRLGRQLHAHWQAVLDARSREAGDAAARLADLARSLRTTEQKYAEADAAVADRVEREA
jgi:hypothetical protein